MTSRNDITGDLITTKQPTEAYRNNFDAIFGKKEEKKTEPDVASDEELSEIDKP